jgi:hypothetical protein
MGIRRYELSEARLERIAPFSPGKVSKRGRKCSDNRLFVNICLSGLRSGAHWCDLTERHGKLMIRSMKKSSCTLISNGNLVNRDCSNRQPGGVSRTVVGNIEIGRPSLTVSHPSLVSQIRPCSRSA